jgi:hypothetical protein
VEIKGVNIEEDEGLRDWQTGRCSPARGREDRRHEWKSCESVDETYYGCCDR